MVKHPYELIDGTTGAIVCVYKAFHIALRDGSAKNTKDGSFRFFVRRVKDGVKFRCQLERRPTAA